MVVNQVVAGSDCGTAHHIENRSLTQNCFPQLIVVYSVRQWSVRNARLLEWFYDHFEGLMVALHPLWLWLGYDRVEGPIRSVERYVKPVIFLITVCAATVYSERRVCRVR